MSLYNVDLNKCQNDDNSYIIMMIYVSCFVITIMNNIFQVH